MPYADPEKAKAVKRTYHAKRLARDPKFREAMNQRSAEWYAENSERHIAAVMERRTMRKLGMR